MNNTPRIKSITVKGLFNQFDHFIELNQEQRITILHGINGVGKTTVLRMINNLFNARLYGFYEIPFDSFAVQLSNNKKIEIKRIHNLSGNIINIFIDDKKVSHKYTDLDDLIEQVPWLSKGQDGKFYDQMEDVLSLEEALEQYEVFEQYDDRLKKNKTVNNFDIVNKLGNISIQFIEASRLVRTLKNIDEHFSSDVIIKHTVKIYAEELQQHLASTMADYGKKAQELEQTFPLRLLKSPEHYSYEQLKTHIEGLQNKRSELRNIGLLPTTDSATLDADSINILESQHALVMSLYVKDSEEKLLVLEELSNKIKLLLTIINSKFQGKELRIDEHKGFIISGKDGEIDPILLSSGEQHQLVMFYDLIFKVQPNTLIMIDEPELSLHITWQSRFIDELKEIVKQSKIDVLIATHSPTIVGNNAQLMVALGNNE